MIILTVEVDMRILMIIGSLRRNSFNRQLAQIAAKMLEGKAAVSVLGYSDIPYMNQDIEFPAPEAVRRAREEVDAADGIWIFSPEYNFNSPGALKNLLDWLSRPLVKNDPERISALTGKKVTLSGAGGKMAASNARKRLAEFAVFMRMRHMEGEECAVTLTPESFASDTLILSEEDERVLRSQAERFAAFAGEKE